jgi:hypothetical protein
MFQVSSKRLNFLDVDSFLLKPLPLKSNPLVIHHVDTATQDSTPIYSVEDYQNLRSQSYVHDSSIF